MATTCAVRAQPGEEKRENARPPAQRAVGGDEDVGGRRCCCRCSLRTGPPPPRCPPLAHAAVGNGDARKLERVPLRGEDEEQKRRARRRSRLSHPEEEEVIPPGGVASAPGSLRPRESAEGGVHGRRFAPQVPPASTDARENRQKTTRTGTSTTTVHSFSIRLRSFSTSSARLPPSELCCTVVRHP